MNWLWALSKFERIEASPKLVIPDPLLRAQYDDVWGLYDLVTRFLNESVSGTHSSMPVSSERQVTANVRTRKRRLLLERVLFELLEESINRLITLFKSCTRASLRRSPLASCFTRKWISPMSQFRGVEEEVLPLPLPLPLPPTFACFHVPGTANASSFLGFAFDCITDTFDENALILGITRGKYSFRLLLTGLNGEIDKAA
mmetsp:Transcript_26176/g.56126  ORF Transcript_26176/g.56126 Transcript_26176/m.56126 type:complete len:201 (-) Transcript_26176:297-899(-)